jgi:hypothetical protein
MEKMPTWLAGRMASLLPKATAAANSPICDIFYSCSSYCNYWEIRICAYGTFYSRIGACCSPV